MTKSKTILILQSSHALLKGCPFEETIETKIKRKANLQKFD